MEDAVLGSVGELEGVPGLTANQVAWLESRGVRGPFRRLAGGFRTDVLESGAGMVVRIGKTPADGNTFSTETSVMNAVHGRIGIAVPRPTLVEDRVPEFPHGVMVYKRLPGASPTSPSKALAVNVASVLRQLQAIETDSPVPDRMTHCEALAELMRTTRPQRTRSTTNS